MPRSYYWLRRPLTQSQELNGTVEAENEAVPAILDGIGNKVSEVTVAEKLTTVQADAFTKQLSLVDRLLQESIKAFDGLVAIDKVNAAKLEGDKLKAVQSVTKKRTELKSDMLKVQVEATAAVGAAPQ